MSYPKQGTWLKKMELETIRASRVAEEKESARLRQMWEATKFTIKARIRDEYAKTFQGQLWDLSRARSSGTLIRIRRHTADLLNLFGSSAAPFIATSLNEAKKERVLRLAWQLDQTTPPIVRPKVGGHRLRLKEAQVSGMVNTYSGDEAVTAWVERFGEWLRAYDEALNRNIALGALNNSAPEDAAAEVDVARVGNRTMDFWDKIDGIFRTERLQAEAEGSKYFGDDNEDMLVAEIWQAYADDRVCDECDGYNGMDRDEVDAEIPLHPNCRCYYRIVPRAYAEYMKALDPDAAASFGSIAPDSLVMRDKGTGKVVGLVWLEFKDWKGNITGH